MPRSAPSSPIRKRQRAGGRILTSARTGRPPSAEALGARGWIGMTWPTRYGGHERSALERYVVIEELLAAGAPVYAHWVADRQSGPLLLRFGSEEQRQTILPRIAAGECYFAIGMSEPDSGSDLASVRTRAERTNDGWRIDGTKVWTSNAHRSHYMIALCCTGPARRGPARRAQPVPDRPRKRRRAGQPHRQSRRQARLQRVRLRGCRSFPPTG